MPFLVVAKNLYDGESEEPMENMAVEIAGSKITDLRPASVNDLKKARAKAEIICPGFVDIQINGANDVQFNDCPTPDGIAAICEGARKGGTTHILPTFITDEGSCYKAAIAAVAEARSSGVSGVLGVHLEGPFLSPQRAGIHPPKAIRPIEGADLSLLTEDTCGVRLITLAPEETSIGVIEELTKSGAIVFAGHSAASYQQMQHAISGGLSGATHLFNAMSQSSVREPGVVGAVLESNSLFAGIIADGVHVHAANLKIAEAALGDRLCLVTDAMLTLAGKTTDFYIDGNKIHRESNRLTDATGRLAGAHLAMDEAVRNMMVFCDVSLGKALYMASANPVRALGMEGTMGRIAPGYSASLTLLDSQVSATATVVDGKLF